MKKPFRALTTKLSQYHEQWFPQSPKGGGLQLKNLHLLPNVRMVKYTEFDTSYEGLLFSWSSSGFRLSCMGTKGDGEQGKH